MSEINLNYQDLTKCSFEEFGADSQIIKMKASLIRKIEEHCKKNKISQRKLASMVDGLIHDYRQTFTNYSVP